MKRIRCLAGAIMLIPVSGCKLVKLGVIGAAAIADGADGCNPIIGFSVVGGIVAILLLAAWVSSSSSANEIAQNTGQPAAGKPMDPGDFSDLDAEEPPAAPESYAIIREQPSDFEVHLLQVMMVMSGADGNVDDQEVEAMASAYKNLTGRELSAEALAQGALAVTESTWDNSLLWLGKNVNPEGAMLVVKIAILVAAIDGVVESSEMARLLAVGSAVGYSKDEVVEILRDLLDIK